MRERTLELYDNDFLLFESCFFESRPNLNLSPVFGCNIFVFAFLIPYKISQSLKIDYKLVLFGFQIDSNKYLNNKKKQ